MKRQDHELQIVDDDNPTIKGRDNPLTICNIGATKSVDTIPHSKTKWQLRVYTPSTIIENISGDQSSHVSLILNHREHDPELLKAYHHITPTSEEDENTAKTHSQPYENLSGLQNSQVTVFLKRHAQDPELRVAEMSILQQTSEGPVPNPRR